MVVIPDAVRDAAEAIIGNLNEDGYLSASLDEIAPLGEHQAATVEAALAAVQSLDPAGVGARITGKKFTIPVLYISQAIGLALGLSPKELGLQRHFVNVALQGKMKVQKNAQVRASAAVA